MKRSILVGAAAFLPPLAFGKNTAAGKPPILKRSICILLACLSLFVGCTTTNTTNSAADTLEEVQFWTHQAAAVGGLYALEENPALAKYFQSAIIALDGIIAGQNFDPLALHQALAILPIKELKSKEARIAILTATIAYERYGRRLDIDQQVYVATVAKSIRDGLQNALATAGVPAVPQLNNTLKP